MINKFSKGLFFMSGYQKSTIICFIISLSLIYSYYEKKKVDQYFTDSSSPVLKSLPKFSLKSFSKAREVTQSKELLASRVPIVVHFWATWCAPCEYELPSFLKLAKRLESLNAKVILMTVRDDTLKVKKFLKRFGEMGQNVLVLDDRDGSVMEKFGVVKVPETFVFNKLGNNVIKFTGPQDWEKPSYFSRIDLSVQKM